LAQSTDTATFPNNDAVDFIIVGSGSAGGIIAKELSTAGFSVVVLEQGPHLQAADFTHDEWGIKYNFDLEWDWRKGHPQTRRFSADEVAVVGDSPLRYAHNVGGGSVHFSGNFWRLREIDFIEASVRGPIAGTNFVDWPITYDELEPYYSKVDWEIGVSGLQGPWDPPRSRDYPCPPMPVKSPGVLLERAAKQLGYHPYPAPVAILSQPHNGRPGCIHCGLCNGYGCEVNAKSSTMVTMLPLALASGNCELRTGCTVSRVVTDDSGRVTEVIYWEQDGSEKSQRAKSVVLSANGAETPRLLLMSESDRFPDGLANSSGMVGKNLMFNGYSQVIGLFDEPVHAYKSVPATRVVHDFWTLDESLGFYGGGGTVSRHPFGGNLISTALSGGMFGGASWGSEYKQSLQQLFTHSCSFDGHTTSLPLSSNNVTLDPNIKDVWGRPAIRVTHMDHPDDIATMKFFMQRSMELMDAAGATQMEGYYDQNGSPWTQHLLGTCRMGNDSETSVVDRYHRSHDIPNLFICDGSSMVSSSRGQPTITIMALAFRAADNIIQAARRGEI